MLLKPGGVGEGREKKKQIGQWFVGQHTGVKREEVRPQRHLLALCTVRRVRAGRFAICFWPLQIKEHSGKEWYWPDSRLPTGER